MDYARAVAALYQASHGEFVAERKRLAGELKAAGDREGAKVLAKLGRPPISAWTVNQLYWHAREAFDRLMATAAQLRDGDLSASAAHREALGRLRQRAATILTAAGHTATEATLRRTAQTLAAIAALGSFAPDPPGALGDDRDPPGFDAAGLVATSPPPPRLSIAPHPEPDPEPETDDDDDDDDDDDPAISPEERDAAADLLRAAATAKPRLTSVPASVRPPDEAPRPRHLSSVPPPLDDDDDDERQIAAARQAAAEAAEKAERARLEAKKRARERDRLETGLRTARGEVESRKREAERLRGDLARADAAVGHASAIVADLERALAALD